MSEVAPSRYVVTPGVGNVFFTSEQLQLIGKVAGSGGRVELTAFMQLIVHTTDMNLDEQHDSIRAAGLGVYPAGAVVKNLQTCSLCSGKKIEGLPDAQRLDSRVAGGEVPFPVRIGFSGCSSNCGEGLVRDIGVVRLDTGLYDIYLGGRPGSLTPQFGQMVAEGVESGELLPVVDTILATYRGQAIGKERMWKTVARVGFAAHEEAVSRVRGRSGNG